MDSVAADAAMAGPGGPAIYFDGLSNRRQSVVVTFKAQLEIGAEGLSPVPWAYSDIRRVDGGPGVLRVACLSAPSLARLEIRDTALATELMSRCTRLGDTRVGGRGIAKIVGWSLAATISIVAVVLFAIPRAADRLAPLVPDGLERRLGDAADMQVKTVFGGRTCNDAAGQAAFSKLVDTLRKSADMNIEVESSVLSAPIPNAFALPGGK